MHGTEPLASLLAKRFYEATYREYLKEGPEQAGRRAIVQALRARDRFRSLSPLAEARASMRSTRRT